MTPNHSHYYPAFFDNGEAESFVQKTIIEHDYNSELGIP